MDSIDERFFEIFDKIEAEYDELFGLVSSVEIMSDHKLYNHYLSKMKKIESLALKIKKYKALKIDLQTTIELENESGENFEKDKNEIKTKQSELLKELKTEYASMKETKIEQVSVEVCSKDDEEFLLLLASLFENYAKLKDFEIEKNDEKNGTIILKIVGENVSGLFKNFSGKIKKVLRGEETFATIVVLKNENQEVVIDEKDLIIQTSKSSGAGGQHINKTESAVKIIHIPTGIFGECQDERSQVKNKERAMQRLIEKITQNSKENAEKLEKNQRKEQKNKIFASTPAVVFDFDANKVSFSLNKKEYKLKEILNGDLDQIFNDRVE